MKCSLVQAYCTKRSRSILPVLKLVMGTGFLSSSFCLHLFSNDLPAWASFHFESCLKRDAPVVLSPQADLLMSSEAMGRAGL